MGLCQRCRTILPPTMMFVTEKGEQICAFCKTGKAVITLEDDNGNFKKFTKQEASGKYKEFADNVMKKPELKKLLVQDDKRIIT